MSKDIYFNNRIFTNVPADELILDYISRMHDKGLRYDTMGSYEVLNAPVDWIDGKEVTGLYCIEKRDAVINVLNRKNPFVMWAAPSSEIPNDLDWSYHQINAINVAVPLPASSGADESYRIPATPNNQFNITALQPPASSGEKEEQEDVRECYPEGGYYYPLWKFFNDEHDLILLDIEIQDIIHAVNEFQKCKHEWVSSTAYKGAKVCIKCNQYK